jgi:alpha-glucosidase
MAGTWYLGAMNGDTARNVQVPLSFLGAGSWTEKLWLDGDRPDAIRRDTHIVSASDGLGLDLAATGGAVAVLRRR